MEECCVEQEEYFHGDFQLAGRVGRFLIRSKTPRGFQTSPNRCNLAWNPTKNLSPEAPKTPLSQIVPHICELVIQPRYLRYRS